MSLVVGIPPLFGPISMPLMLRPSSICLLPCLLVSSPITSFETVVHALLSCSCLHFMRKLLSSLYGRSWDDNVNFINILIFYSKSLRLDEFLELLVVLWRLWFRRNSLHYDTLLLKDADVIP
ncbi:hypothetical protein ACOSQ4_021271 [Xanthoceras sorbifolium]